MSGQLIKFPDAEQLVIDCLEADDHLDVDEISTRVSTGTTSIRVMRFGGPKETLVTENAQIILESWADDELVASDNLAIARAILNAQDGTIFGVTEISGPNNLPDPLTSRIRYTQNFGVRVRGSVLA